MNQPTSQQASKPTVLEVIHALRSKKALKPCRECGAVRKEPLRKEVSGGKSVPVCGPCKARCSKPTPRQAGFLDALQGVPL